MLYRERLTVPVLWWLLAVLLAVSFLLAFGFYLGPVWGVGMAVGTLAVAAAIFAAAAIVITVDDRELRVGRSVVEHRYLGGCTDLDAEQTTRRAGVAADARAYLALRPYIPTAVEITLADPADPVPYWLVASRRPTELAAALRRAPTIRLTR